MAFPPVKTTPARHAARARAQGWLARDIHREPDTKDGPLTGESFYAKDLFAIGNEITRSGSAVFDRDDPAKTDCALVARARALGARLLGTTNMDALAYGFVTNNADYGLARNPRDPNRICGGSSGGSAAVVADGLASFAFGTDTSGSIRVPSAFCGVAGYKPSAGVFSSAGIATLSPTFDRPGLFAKTCEDLRDIAFWLAEPGKLASKPPTPQRIGMLGGYFAAGLEPAIEHAMLDFAIQSGARTGLDINGGKQARAAAYILVADEAAQIFAERLKRDPDVFDAETRCRLTAASLVKDGWCKLARKVQQDFTYRFDRMFDDFDILLAPCVPTVAPLISELDGLPDRNAPPLRASLGRLTQPISLTGSPVVTVPIATPVGLPTAVQLIGRVGSDASLLGFAAELCSRVQLFKVADPATNDAAATVADKSRSTSAA